MATMTEMIDVDTDPVTAFMVFTTEFDDWWGHGPIDAYSTWQLVQRRIEPGVGGRLVEDYGDELRVTGTITMVLPGTKKNVKTTFHDMLYVPDLQGNLLSVSHLASKDYDITFKKDQWIIRRSGTIRAIGTRRDNLYLIEAKSTRANQATIKNDDILLWHSRLGHVNEK